MAARSRAKAPARKTASRRAPAKSAKTRTRAKAKKAAPAKKIGPVIRTKLRKNDVINLISSETAVSKDQVRKVLEKREEIIERALKPRSVGVFQDGSLVKFERYRRKATKKRVGRNLKTNEIPAKPAQNAVKVKKLTKLKSMVKS